MTYVHVNPTTTEPTHDLALTDGKVKLGLQYNGDERILQVIPISPPQQDIQAHQNTFVGGRGRRKLSSDPTGYYDSGGMWTLVDEKLLLAPKWYFAQGYRSADFYQPDSMTFRPLIGAKRYIASSFAASASYTAEKIYLWVKKVGTPRGALTMELCSTLSGSPSTVLKSKTLTTAGVTDILSIFNEFDIASQSLTSGTTYWVKIYGASGDNRSNHWEVGTATYTSGAKVSSDDSTWTAVNYRLAFRVVDNTTYNRRKNRKWFPFAYYGGLYSVHTASLFINGDRGKATSGGASTLTDTGKSWGTTRFVGARVRIIDGTGDGQDRAIASHTATALTVDTAWETNPDSTSVYIIYATDYWTALTGHGLTAVTGQPVSANQICYMPQAATAMRKMRINGSTHEYNTATETNVYLIETNTHPTNGVQLMKANAKSAAVAIAPAPTTWATDPTFATGITVGSSDTQITGLLSHENYFYVLKEDNIFKMDGNTPRGLGKGFSTIADSSNGFASCVKEPGFWFSWGNSVSQFVNGTAQDRMNYRPGYYGLPSNRTGTVSWLDTGSAWLFCCIDGGTSHYSSVLMFNEMGWMEIFRGWKTGERIDSIAWQSNEDAAPRLWIFIGDDIVYMDFPYNNNNPLNSTMNYLHEGYLETSEYDADDPILSKLIHRFVLITENMRAANKTNTLGAQSIQLQMKINAETRWRDVGRSYASPVAKLVRDIDGVRKVKLRLIFRTSEAATTPVLTSWGVDGWKTSEIKYQFVGQYRTSYNQKTRSTKELDHTPKMLIDTLTKWAMNTEKLKLLSVDPAIHGKNVVIAAPAITKSYSRPKDPSTWEGAFSLYIREA